MRLFVTGGTGFVGSNIVKVATERHGAAVTTSAHSWQPSGSEKLDVVHVDMTDSGALRHAVETAAPDAVVHAAILNDFPLMYADRDLAWESYVGSTRTLIDAANSVGATMVLISTDWVFDGTQTSATEQTPPNPINLYGVLKVVAETLVSECARNGAVARVAGVNGTHWLRNDHLPEQNPGLGHLAGAVVRTLRSDQPFAVWTGPVNMIGTPSLASESAEMIMRIIEREAQGIFHCCTGQVVDRVEFAHAVAAAFDLDVGRVTTGSPDLSGTGPAPIPFDTSLDAGATAAALDYELPSLTEWLATYRFEQEHGRLAG